MEYVLKTNSLCKNYGHFKALNGLSMNVPKGSIYGLIGKNGAGKTNKIIVGQKRETIYLSNMVTCSIIAITMCIVFFVPYLSVGIPLLGFFVADMKMIVMIGIGIPCMWDRLIQQCIKQVLEPICEAKFSENSYGFRPNRSVENAIKATYNRLQISQLHYVIEFDIKGFFDNVNHSKLIKQVWAMGIRDKHLIFILKRILKAPIKMPNGTIIYPDKGTPQGGIISPLLANIVLNELDHWVESQWQENPVTKNYVVHINKSGSPCKSNRTLWLIVVIVGMQFIGPILYFLLGKEDS